MTLLPLSRRRVGLLAAGLGMVLCVGLYGLIAAPAANAATRIFTGIGVTGSGDGYALIATSGEGYHFGTVVSRGNPRGFTGDIVDVAVTPDGKGYAAVSSAGQVYAYGTVRHWGNPSGFTGEITSISVTADGQGYIVVSSAGQNYAYGTVRHWGNPSGFTGRIVAVAVTADGQGYVEVSSAGQNYAYGTVRSWPNPSGFSGEMVDVAVTADGQGFIEVSSAGQNYAYGTARYFANPSQFTGTIVGVAVTADGQGYANLSSFGQVYAYGTVIYRGNGDPGQPGTNAAQLAQQIRTNNRIRLWDVSSSPSRDRADRSLASLQLADLAAGKRASTSTRCGRAASLRYTKVDVRILGFLAELGTKMPYGINTLAGQCHSPGSRHYVGKAVDLNCQGSPIPDIRRVDEVAAKYGARRNYETCARHKHWHYSVD